MISTALAPVHVPAPPDVSGAASDDQFVDVWLNTAAGSPHTRSAYAFEIERFRQAVPKPLGAMTLADLQGFAASLLELAPATQARALAAVKSLFGLGHRLGYLRFDVGRPVRVPQVPDTLAERLLSEADVQRMLALEENPRNHAFLRLLYAAGLRVSEATALRWRDLAERAEGGQVTVLGKGSRTRSVVLSQTTWSTLTCLRREDDGPDDLVFVSRNRGGRLTTVQAGRIVTAAAVRAGITAKVSPHWLRHAHASHAIDRGAPTSLVSQTLGHRSLATTGRYLHARPGESSSRYLAV